MHWTNLRGLENISSPRLLVDPASIRNNIQRMVQIAGSPERLRPHVKTHKMPAVIELQLAAGISKCKVATLAEAEMAAAAGVQDILWAYPPVGPNITAFQTLVRRYRPASFAVAVDAPETLDGIARVFSEPSEPLRVFLDIDCGMHRTGIPLNESLLHLRDAIDAQPGLTLGGLHVYDGHIHDPSLSKRQARSREIIDQVRELLQRDGWPGGMTVVGGGSPTFAIWASETDWECSPGTPFLWDIGYGRAYPDLDFAIAAAVLTRVISRPGAGRLCFDLGYKAIAAESPLEQRLWFPAFPDAEIIGQSEEHLVIKTDRAKSVAIGDPFCALPKHICPTVALHDQAYLIEDGAANGARWEVTARRREQVQA